MKTSLLMLLCAGCATHAPLPHWPLLKIIPGSQRSTRVERTQPQKLFVLTASNRLGESGFATQ